MSPRVTSRHAASELTAAIFFQLVNALYEPGVMIVTSNRSFKEWSEILRDAVVAAPHCWASAPQIEAVQKTAEKLTLARERQLLGVDRKIPAAQEIDAHSQIRTWRLQKKLLNLWLATPREKPIRIETNVVPHGR